MKDEDDIKSGGQREADKAEGLLTRWSRRKLEASGATESARPPIPQAADAQDPHTDIAAPAPELTDADMPPIESLSEDSDYSVFLSPKVSEGLRQRALQKLFSLAQFDVCDGLDDYAEDFTHFAGLGNIVTHEMRHLIERQKEKLAEALELEGEQPGSEPQWQTEASERNPGVSGPEANQGAAENTDGVDLAPPGESAERAQS